MLGGVFELLARGAVVVLVLHLGRCFVQTCLSDPAAWISALIPLIPYYIYKMRKYTLQESKKCYSSSQRQLRKRFERYTKNKIKKAE